MKFSILICSLVERKKQLSDLLSLLEKQKSVDVEILVEIDNHEITIGEKRNSLLRRAKGDYIAFIDDDDLVAENYISKILKAIEKEPDCCGIEGIITRRGYPPRKFIHSIKYNRWFMSGGVYYRSPNHLSPVKRQLALKTMFPKQSKGEDHIYSMKLFPMLKIEEYIENPIYFYRS